MPVLKPSCIFHLCSTSPVVQPYCMQPCDDFKSSIITWFLTQEFRLRCFLLMSRKLVVVYLRHLFSFGTKSLWPIQSHLGVVGLTPASSRSFSEFCLMWTEVRISSYNQEPNWHRNLSFGDSQQPDMFWSISWPQQESLGSGLLSLFRIIIHQNARLGCL